VGHFPAVGLGQFPSVASTSNPFDEANQGLRLGRTPAEAENGDLVAGLVVRHQEPVGSLRALSVAGLPLA
jgi:hypothetical protein